MNIDLSSGGITLPVLVGAALAALAYIFTGKKEAAQAGIVEKLAGMIGGKAQLIPILVALYQNRAELRGTVAGFLDAIRKIVHPPEAPK